MAEPLPTTTLAWLRQTAKFEGAVTAQVLLHLLERVEVLEAADHFVELPKMAPTPEAALAAAPVGECPGCEGAPAASNSPCAVCGHPAAPPAPEPGEAGELVEFLDALAAAPILTAPFVAQIRRAAALLQRQAAPAPVAVPVAVNERLPGEGDCDVEGKCWWYGSGLDPMGWHFGVDDGYLDCTHWLPAHAIPMPQVGEGE